jgi:hypothetical protein
VLFSAAQPKGDDQHTEADGCACCAVPTARQEYDPMFHEIIFAIFFLAMIAAPAFVSASSDKNKRDDSL